jgi:predicted transcriptional regulator
MICANFVHRLRGDTSVSQFGVYCVPIRMVCFSGTPLPWAHLADSFGMTKAFSIFGSGSRPQLGPFEQQVLQKLWSQGSATVRELLADGKIRQAYTTVMTTVDRLYKKGLLDRVAEGRAFRYTPRQTPEELQRVAALEGIRQLLGSGDASSLPLSYLVEALSAHDAQLLDELQLLVERKRRELKAREINDRENNDRGPR